MSTEINTPNYPVISWPVYYTDEADTLDIECDGVTDSFFPSDLDFQGVYGFSSNDLGGALSDSLHGLLATKIEDFLISDCGYATASCSAVYDWTLPGWPLVRFVVNNVPEDITISPSSKEVSEFFGIRWDGGAGEVVIDSVTEEGSTDFNSAGYWAPHNLTCYDDRVLISPATYTAQSLDGTVNKTVAWSSSKTRRQLTFPFVRPSYLWLYRRQDTGWATPAGLDITDPNNLFQNMMEAARRNNTSQDSTIFRVYADGDNYREACLIDNIFIKDPADSVLDTNGRAATYFEVSVPFTEPNQ